MLTLLIAVGAFVGYLIAYHTYGRWLSRKIFQLDDTNVVPSHELRDDVDFVPTKRQVIFGHHFTSIAGTGPIVGPAIAVFWGWLPALIWVFVGSIFIGAVHDFGALVVSLRNRGQTVGEVAGRLISPRARVLFLVILFMALTVVLAIFGLVIASIFKDYPESVLGTWISLPLAVAIGFWVYKKGGSILVPSLIALAIVYLCIWLGAYAVPIDIAAPVAKLQTSLGIGTSGFLNVITMWTFVLLVYCFVASVLPVWVMLQPRDYVNSHQLVVALGLLMIGVVVAGATGAANLEESAPMIASSLPSDAPPIWPFLFITIACGACSGFHCLVSSGTTSKQIEKESDAQYVAYGSMLLEGGLAIMVILACCAGVGMGAFEKVDDATAGGGYRWEARLEADGSHATGAAAWNAQYNIGKKWGDFKLSNKVGAFVNGGANFLTSIGIPLKLGISVIAVLVACFAATTLDSATRLQRYVVQELAGTLKIKPLENKYVATAFAVMLAGFVAAMPAAEGMPAGTGGLILWPLFGATNQLLAGLAFMVTMFYLWRRNKPVWFVAIPMTIMLIMPAWAMLWQLFNAESGWYGQDGSQHLFVTGILILGIQFWMIVEALIVLPRVKGVAEEGLPPLKKVILAGADGSSGPNC
ncbi:MAG: carbon starvation protein A [Planctomycetota bacterium]|nr:carbon starvation protein A [Planctomycetota bacterium]